MNSIIPYLLLIVWAILWIYGGWLISQSLFKLHANEEGMVGFIVGLSGEVGLINFIGRLLPFDAAIWVSAGSVLVTGIIIALRKEGFKGLRIKIIPWQWVAFIFITYLFFLISRGLAIYDDFAHLPTLSILATGENPILFPLNPEIPYDYHYFLLLFGAQIMRITQNFPWTAWDIARSITVAPAVLLGGLFTYRVTKNKMAQLLGGAGVLFISGTRWLLLLIPDSILSKLSQKVVLIGAGAASGPTLVASLPNPWPVEGQGSFPFPYAFLSGIFTSGAESVHNVMALMITAIFFVLLLTASRWRDRWAILPTVILISSLGLLTEIELTLMGVALILISIFVFFNHRKFKLPKNLMGWWLTWILSGIIVAFQGGALTGSFNEFFLPLIGKPVPASYQVSGLQLASPSIVSHHLGILNLLDFNQLFIALVEIGPVLLAIPLILIWGLKAVRSERWFEAVFFVSAILSLFMVFVHFSGSLRNTSRLYFFASACKLMVVPAIWLWASHRSNFVKNALGLLAGITMFGGIVMLGVQLPNIKYHQFSSFISSYDVKMEMKYWNKLEPGALIFDPNPYRATTVFGRHTQSSSTWYQMLPSYENLIAEPDIKALTQEGFSYAYFDEQYWNQLSDDQKSAFQQPCVIKLDQITKPDHHDWRVLYDLRGCKQPE